MQFNLCRAAVFAALFSAVPLAAAAQNAPPSYYGFQPALTIQGVISALRPPGILYVRDDRGGYIDTVSVGSIDPHLVPGVRVTIQGYNGGYRFIAQHIYYTPPPTPAPTEDDSQPRVNDDQPADEPPAQTPQPPVAAPTASPAANTPSSSAAVPECLTLVSGPQPPNNIRTGPSLQSPVLTTMPNDQIVKVDTVSNGWSHMTYPVSGWIVSYHTVTKCYRPNSNGEDGSLSFDQKIKLGGLIVSIGSLLNQMGVWGWLFGL